MVPKEFFRVLAELCPIYPKKAFKISQIKPGSPIIKNTDKLLNIIIVISTKYINKLLNVLQQEKTNKFKYNVQVPPTSK